MPDKPDVHRAKSPYGVQTGSGSVRAARGKVTDVLVSRGSNELQSDMLNEQIRRYFYIKTVQKMQNSPDKHLQSMENSCESLKVWHDAAEGNWKYLQFRSRLQQKHNMINTDVALVFGSLA